jgi:hypothetical protein
MFPNENPSREYLPEELTLYTINEACQKLYPSLTFSDNNKISIGMMVSTSWMNCSGNLPQKVARPNARGSKLPCVSAYPESFLTQIKLDILRFVGNL